MTSVERATRLAELQTISAQLTRLAERASAKLQPIGGN